MVKRVPQSKHRSSTQWGPVRAPFLTDTQLSGRKIEFFFIIRHYKTKYIASTDYSTDYGIRDEHAWSGDKNENNKLESTGKLEHLKVLLCIKHGFGGDFCVGVRRDSHSYSVFDLRLRF